jgi:hypothetical protein
MAMSFENRDDQPLYLLKLEVAMQKLVPAADGNGYTADGPKAILVTRDYTDVAIATKGTYQDAIALTPSLRGNDIALEFDVDYGFLPQPQPPFHGVRYFYVTIP